MGWLHDHFYSCTDVIDETQLQQYACAYMLSIIGGFIYCNAEQHHQSNPFRLGFDCVWVDIAQGEGFG
ncbi:hypothetical protein LINGRAPRIM_LOCUS344 [Linum grandiflorum]